LAGNTCRLENANKEGGFEQEETEITEFFQFSVLSVCSCSKFLRPALPGEKGGNAGAGTKAGPVLGCDWPATPAAWKTQTKRGILNRRKQR
jgi:hypothetical protein